MKTVVIVGVGALGSQAAVFLRNAAAIRVIDDDRVEAKNIQSQFHGKPGIGKPKALALAGAMDLFWGKKIAPNTNRLTEANALVVLAGADLVLDCLDNAVSRRVVQTYARRTCTPCLHGAVAADGSFGRVAWDERFVVDEENAAGAATCEDGEHLPFLGIVSAHLAHAAKEFLRTGARFGYQVTPHGTIFV